MRSLPIIRSTIDRGAFPRRNPGTSTRPARRRNASSTARSRRSCSTSMASETWRGGNSVEETFAAALLLGTIDSVLYLEAPTPWMTRAPGGLATTFGRGLIVDAHRYLLGLR